MKTWQDLIEVGEDEQKRIDFIKTVINEHVASPVYRTALTAQDYYDGINESFLIHGRRTTRFRVTTTAI